MHLLVLAYAAALSTAAWYSRADRDSLRLKELSLILWGATLMFFIDKIYALATEGGPFLELGAERAALGFSLLLVAILLWLALLLITDPRRVLRAPSPRNPSARDLRDHSYESYESGAEARRREQATVDAGEARVIVLNRHDETRVERA